MKPILRFLIFVLLSAACIFGTVMLCKAQSTSAPTLPESVPLDNKVIIPVAYKGIGYKITADRIGGGSIDFADSVQIKNDQGSNNIACWGNSLTAANPGYPSHLSTLTGLYVFNGGVGGETSTQIKNRMVIATDRHNYSTILWAGRNNTAQLSTVLSDIAQMVSKLGHDRCIILSVTNGQGEGIGTTKYNEINAINAALADEYGAHFLDVRSFLVSQYNPAIPQDVADHAADITPSSLRYDAIHFTQAGYQLVAKYIFDNKMDILMPSYNKAIKAGDAAKLLVRGNDVLFGRIRGREATLIGINDTVVTKAIHKVYLRDATDAPLFRFQKYRWDGAAWLADNGYHFGLFAGQNNTGSNGNFYGFTAGQNNTGLSCNAYGVAALRYNTGLTCNAFGLEAGMNNNAASLTAIGTLAARDNTGANVTALGHNTLQNNTASNATAVGSLAMRGNTGNNSNAFGFAALMNNAVQNVNGFGFQAAMSNTGANSNAFGSSALETNSGASSNGFGASALQTNTAANVNAFGYLAGQNNKGGNSNGFGLAAIQNNDAVQVSGFGHNSLQNNKGPESSAIGYLSGQYNVGYSATAIGSQSLRYNNWHNVTYIGQTSNVASTFILDPATEKSFTPGDIDVFTKRITIPAHGFGFAGFSINLKFKVTSGSAPSGLIDGQIYQFNIIDANTLSTNLVTSPGTGTFSLTLDVLRHNTTAIGYDAYCTKTNQVVLGNGAVTEVFTTGNVIAPNLYSKTNLLTPGESQVHWDNIVNKPPTPRILIDITITSPKTSADMEALYPGEVIGTMITAPNESIGNGKVFQKAGPGAWVQWTITGI